jgi:hypothetical protein
MGIVWKAKIEKMYSELAEMEVGTLDIPPNPCCAYVWTVSKAYGQLRKSRGTRGGGGAAAGLWRRRRTAEPM